MSSPAPSPEGPVPVSSPTDSTSGSTPSPFTSAPPATSAPSSTSAPPFTSAPPVTSAPFVTSGTSAASAPPFTSAPPVTSATFVTSVPFATSAPPFTSAPPVTLAPSVTSVPSATSVPPATSDPSSTSAPPFTSAPPGTSAPIVTSVPPATSASPFSSAPPVTSAPIETSVPSATSVPLATSVPSATSAPPFTSVPPSTSAPRVFSVPPVTLAPPAISAPPVTPPPTPSPEDPVLSPAPTPSSPVVLPTAYPTTPLPEEPFTSDSPPTLTPSTQTPAPGTEDLFPAPPTPVPKEVIIKSSMLSTEAIGGIAVAAFVMLISCAGGVVFIFRRRKRQWKTIRKSGPAPQEKGFTGSAGEGGDMEQGHGQEFTPGVIENRDEDKAIQVSHAAPAVNPETTDSKHAEDSRTSMASIHEAPLSTVSISTASSRVNTAPNVLDPKSAAYLEVPEENVPDDTEYIISTRDAIQKPGHRRHSSTSSSATTILRRGYDFDEENAQDNVSKDGAELDDNEHMPGHARASRFKKAPSFAVLQAVIQAAQELAQQSTVPGVVEVATLVTLLVRLFVDHEGNAGTSVKKLRWCRSIVFLLDRASAVLGKGGTSQVGVERLLLDDVRESIDDMLQIIHAYKGRNKLARVMTSSLFKRRQQDAEVVVNMAIARLQMGLQVRGDEMISALSSDVRKSLELHKGYFEDHKSEDKALAIAEARRERRQRRLDDLEIPEDLIFVTTEVLGKGGFGSVYMADFNGRNAAAKVIPVELDTEGPGGSRDGGRNQGADDEERMDPQAKQLKTFMRELEAMMRLRSPHTVNVYGAITSRRDSLVLVMELMPGGDLRRILKTTDAPLEPEYARRIVGDICAGMAFLHGKHTIHGDMKSANVLFDGYGRAKIADFGTSRWIQRTASTGLATYSTQNIQTTHMSFPWAAPEVWNNGVNSYGSDVYSFGIVVWEVLSRRVPWASEPTAEHIYRKVVIQKERPPIPEEAPDDLAKIARSCWDPDPQERLTFKSVLKSMKENGWQAG